MRFACSARREHATTGICPFRAAPHIAHVVGLHGVGFCPARSMFSRGRGGHPCSCRTRRGWQAGKQRASGWGFRAIGRPRPATQSRG